MPKNFIETQVDFLKSVKLKDLKLNQKITLVGAFLLFLGAFSPVLQLGLESSSILNTSIALYKNNTYANLNTSFTGFLIVITSIVIAYLALFPKNKFIALANTVGFVLYLYSFLNILSFANQINTQQQEFQANILKAFYGTNIAGSLSGLTKSYDINWLGWGLMLAGIAVVFYSVRSEILPIFNQIKVLLNKTKSATSKEQAQIKSDTPKVNNEEIAKEIKKTDDLSSKDENVNKEEV